MEKKKRLYDVDRAKGLAIFLVVYGHLIADIFPAGNQWYELTNKMVYRFHMPFFMFLSGLTMFYSYRGVDSARNYFSFVAKKFVRIAPAFVLFGTAILVGKILASRFLLVDNVPDNILNEFLLMLAAPGQSAAGSLWYIYALFEITALFPLLLLLVKGRVETLIPLLLVLYFLKLTPFFLIDSIFEYLIFFTLGAVAVVHYESYLKYIDSYRALFWVIFCLSFLLMYFGVGKEVSKLVIGLCSIPALHALVRTQTAEKMHFLISWGLLSFSIYLMNTITIGLAKGITLKFMDWDGHNFLIVAPILLVAGLYGPIFIKRYIIARIPIIDRITS